MADNSAQNATDTIRDKDRAGVKTQIVGLDLGIGTGTESLMAGSMPVTGTFWQATQPVSMATNTPDVTDRAARLLGVISAGTNNIGKVTRSTDGLRTAVSINYNATAPPTADTLLTTLALNKGATATASQTSIPVTSGKILRLTHVIVGVRATVATLPYGLLTLRVNHTGAAVLTSPAFFQVPVSGTAAVIGNTGTTPASIEDGFELSGTMQLGLSYSGNLATNVVSVSVLGYEYTA